MRNYRGFLQKGSTLFSGSSWVWKTPSILVHEAGLLSWCLSIHGSSSSLICSCPQVPTQILSSHFSLHNHEIVENTTELFTAILACAFDIQVKDLGGKCLSLGPPVSSVLAISALPPPAPPHQELAEALLASLLLSSGSSMPSFPPLEESVNTRRVIVCKMSTHRSPFLF